MENTSRDMLADLVEGATDGTYKKVVRDRGGVVEDATYQQRQDMSDVWFGIHETDPKNIGDGQRRSTPNYRGTGNWRLT